LKYLKTLILWILALQLLNMSICSEAYWYYYNEGNPISLDNTSQADPTETFVELLVEMRLGQQDAFTYDQHNIDPKNTIKSIACRVDLAHDWTAIHIFRTNSRIYFPDISAKIESAPLEIISPPPDLGLHCFQFTV